MNHQKSKHISPIFSSTLNVTASVVVLLLCLAAAPAQDGDQNGRLPELPSPLCDMLQAPAGSKLSHHVYALGVQIYKWDGAKWVFTGPSAALYADPCYAGQVGIHYADQGDPTHPAWEINGSKVIGARLAGCTPNRGAIAWLLLGATPTSPVGVLGRTTHIQRINTIGGTAPAEAGLSVGDEARVPYTTEYYFYR